MFQRGAVMIDLGKWITAGECSAPIIIRKFKAEDFMSSACP